jgi:diguanylate cyclase (GGDEF)-like protein
VTGAFPERACLTAGPVGGLPRDLPGGLPGDLAAELRRAPAWLALPLHCRDARLGVLVLTGDPGDPRLLQDTELATALVAQANAAYDNAELFARLERLATADELTGLANRRRFFELAERDLAAARHDRPLAAVMLDIDHFKQVNDTYGHPTGDDVIREVAARVAAELRVGDTIGRYGGEEFALLIHTTADTDLPERLRTAVCSEPLPTRSGPLAATISIGLTWHRSDDTITTLLARADQALYRAKHDGRNCVRTA